MNGRFYRSCPIFADIDDLSPIDGCLRPRIKNSIAGEKLELTIGSSRFFGLVFSGSVVCDYGVYKKGDCFGLCFALNGHENTDFTAATKSTVLLIPTVVLTGCCDESCQFQRAVVANCLRLVSAELDAERIRTRLLAIHGIRQRLSAYLKTVYDGGSSCYLTLPFNRKELAAYLALSRPSMSRELGALRDLGVLEYDGNTIKILKPEELC